MNKILIIDDDPDMRNIISTLLGNNYEIKEASSSKAAKDILKSFTPDLVVLDVMMEEYDSGFTLARELKESDKYKSIKILMTTNVDNEMKIDFEKEAGNSDWLPVDDYIVKPVKAKNFIPKVEALLKS